MSEQKKQYVRFKGEVKWAQIYPGQERGPYKDSITEQNKNDKYYSIDVECSKELFDKLIKAGIPRLTSLREDEKSKKHFIKLKASKVKGNYTFDDPVVTDANDEQFDKKIGNGSEAIVTAELAEIKGRSGKALRLKKVQVLKHVPYEEKEYEIEYLDDLGGDTPKEKAKKVESGIVDDFNDVPW